MSIQNGTRIVSPINLQEPYTVMGVSKTGTYYDLGYICGNSHGRINKWSRHKPVRVNQPGIITDAQFKSANFGLTIPAKSTDFKTAINNATYSYNPPRPGTDWCRLTDFDKYSHTAVSPLINCQAISFDRTFIDEQYIFPLTLNHRGHDDYNIGLDEFPGFSSMYLGCIIEYTQTGSSTIYRLFKTASTTIGQSGFSVTFENLYGRNMVNPRYYLVAASKMQETQTSLITGVDFLGLPFDTVAGASSTLSISASNPLLATLLGATDNPTGSRYIAVGDAVPGGLAYTCNANTGLWMQCEITNRATKSYTMSLTDLDGELRPSWDINASNDYTNSTTGYIQMQVYRLSGSTWTKVSESGTITFSPSSKVTLRIGHPQWSRYIDGALGSAVKASAYVDYCEVRIIDRKSGMQIVNPGCRIHFT